MTMRDVTPIKTVRAGDDTRQSVEAPMDPLNALRADLDVMLDAQAVQLDTTTTTKQRSDAAKAIRALITKRLRPDGT